MRPIPERQAIVTFKGSEAGLLSETSSGSQFVYDEGWTKTIACALPVDQRDHYWRGGLIPFFEHLGPEGWLRGRQAKAGGTADQDDFGLLLNYAADCIGAVGIRPADGAAPLHPEHGDIVEEAATTASRTLSGVQKKLLAFRREEGFQPSVRSSDPATHIAKFNRDDLSTLVQNEHLSLRLAREVLGVAEVTAASVDTVQGIEGIALLVERFDRDGEQRLRLEDFAQILGKPRGRDFHGKYDGSYEEAASAIVQHSARSRIDLDRFFRLVVFNLVIGNADAHLKNFSLLERKEGLRLAPAYDLVNTLVYPQYDQEIALEIGGRKWPFETLNRALIERLGADIGLPSTAVTQALSELKDRFEGARVIDFPSHIQPDDFRCLYRDVVREQSHRIFT